MRHAFSYGGICCQNFGIYCSGKGTAHTPVRDQSFVEIPGRSGDLVIDNGRWKNVGQEYECYVYGSFLERFKRFRNAVLAEGGYHRLEDTYNPDEYRMAAIDEAFDPDIIRLHSGMFTISFNCKPQRYLKAGEVEHIFTGNGTLINPEETRAKPLISVTGNGTLYIGDYTIVIKGASGALTIDSDLMDAWDSQGNANSKISITGSGYPTLRPGVNGVALGTGITRVTVKPRWWRL